MIFERVLYHVGRDVGAMGHVFLNTIVLLVHHAVSTLSFLSANVSLSMPDALIVQISTLSPV